MRIFPDIFDTPKPSFISVFSICLTETLRNTDVALVSLLPTLKRFHTFLFHSWILGTVAGWVYEQISKYRQVEIMKHARADGNYAILTKLVQLQDEKKPVSNLLSMQIVGFEQTFMKFIDSSEVCNKYIYEVCKGKEMHRHYVQADTLLFICYCWRSKFIMKIDMKT